MRVLATPTTVHELFERVAIPYPAPEGTVEVQGWRCRACRWESLMGIRDLPFPHDCSGVVSFVPLVAESFQA